MLSIKVQGNATSRVYYYNNCLQFNILIKSFKVFKLKMIINFEIKPHCFCIYTNF